MGDALGSAGRKNKASDRFQLSADDEAVEKSGQH